MKLSKYIDKLTAKRTNISPYVFIGLYGHTYLHSQCGLFEKVKQSSMSSIVENLHIREMVGSTSTSIIALVMCITLIYCFNSYGGSLSYFSLLLFFGVKQALDMVGAVVNSFAEFITFDCVEQLSEGDVLQEFSGLVQTLSENIPVNDGYQLTHNN